jgi:hypothetical protein
LEQTSLDYSKIGQLTMTDFILELVRFEKIPYYSKTYTDQDGKVQTASTSFTFWGAVAEFKLVSVKENDLVGSYLFNYTPCLQGCSHQFSRSISRSYVSAETFPGDLFKTWAIRLISELSVNH